MATVDPTRIFNPPKQMKNEPGLKFDGDKPRLDLISTRAMEGLGRVLGYGALQKYGVNNWRKGMSWSRLVAAARRHLAAFNDGEDIDPESGLPHIDHVACCIMFLSEYGKHEKYKRFDDRYKDENE